MEDIFDPIYPDELAVAHPLICDEDTKFQELNHVYAIRVNNSWTTEGVISVTKWIKEYEPEDSKFEMIAVRKAKSLNSMFNATASLYPRSTLYDLIDERDWNASVACVQGKAKAADAFAHRILSDPKFVRLPYKKDTNDELRTKYEYWKQEPNKTLEFFTECFGDYEPRVMAALPHLTGNDVRDLWPRFGTRLHHDIEYYLNNRRDPAYTGECVEWKQVMKFMRYLEENGYTAFRTELTMSVPSLLLCGQADFIAKKPDGKFILFDWKRTSSVRADGKDPYVNDAKPMLGPWSHRKCTSRNKYTIQLNIYRQMLKTYKIEVDEMFLVCFHKDFGETYNLVPIQIFVALGDHPDSKAIRQMIEDRRKSIQ
jgi:hypothetical protein